MREKSKEAVTSLLPIVVIVLVLNFTITPAMPFGVRGLFIGGALLLVLGMSLFTMGADMAMMPIGEHLGQFLTKSRKLWLIAGASLVMGTMVTIAEPDLQILARQVPGVPDQILPIIVAVGLGAFLVIAMLRIMFMWNMSYLLSGLYIGVLILGIFVPQEYLAVSFDAGGVTTGPFAIPFILALGVGVASVRGGKSTMYDSFGLAALCSIGPIYAVMILGFNYPAKESTLGAVSLDDIHSMGELIMHFLKELPEYAHEIGLAVLPLVAVFFLFQIFALRLPLRHLVRIGIGLIYTFLGLTIFLTGVGVGFMPAGAYIGKYVGGLDYNWILIPIGVLMGYFIVLAEPAVHVLINSVEEMTSGAIARKTLLRAFSISVGISVGLSMFRVLTEISIWWVLVPGYGLAIALSFFVPKVFTAIAFDSGAVASGPMTATFLLPFTMGACAAAGGNVMMDAFGVVAMVAMTPLFTIQIIGLMYDRRIKAAKAEEQDEMSAIAESVEENAFVDWGLAPPAATHTSGAAADDNVQDDYVQDDYAQDADMDFVASPEWVQAVHTDEVHESVIMDNNYIDFDECESR
jgi:hypothetical protein